VRLWEAVEKHLAEPWTMSEMAQVASLSAEHLRRLSRAATGRSPHAHLMHLRMKRAAELLLSTDWPIKRIAEVVGYANPFVFSTTFKKVIGWPPSSYAARNDADGARKRQRK
jgi:AraC-like DNA-binding protein